MSQEQDIIAQFRELARKTPKSDIAIFAGRVGGRLMDNVKYLFRHCVQNEVPFAPYFLTHHEDEHATLTKAGLPSLLFPTPEAAMILPKARLVVADDFWWKMRTPAYHLLTHAKTLQIWHGIPLKLIGFPEIESDVNMTEDKAEHLRQGYSGYDVAISTSPFVTETSLGKVFDCGEMWETGYPRNDVLLREPDGVDLLGVDVPALKRIKRMRAQGMKSVFFMPTFRDTGGDPFSDGALDLAAMNDFGKRSNIVFVIKFHPYVSIQADLGMDNVNVVRPETDAYPLMSLADCLLTDYSSVAYDFLLTGRPQVFFPYDLVKYVAKDRAMFYPFQDMAPGPHPTKQNQLFKILHSILVEGKDTHADTRDDLARKLFSHLDGNAAERITARMIDTFFKAGQG